MQGGRSGVFEADEFVELPENLSATEAADAAELRAEGNAYEAAGLSDHDDVADLSD